MQDGFRKGRGTRDQISNIIWIMENARECLKNICFCIFDCGDHSKLWKILKEMGLPDHLTCLKRNLYIGHEARVIIDMGQWTGSKLGKEYIKAAYCHSAYLTYMQNTSCKMLS